MSNIALRLNANDPPSVVSVKMKVIKMKTERDVDGLIAALKSREPLLSVCAAEALGDIGDARAVEPLIAALKRKTHDIFKPYEVDGIAVDALANIGAPAVEPLISVLKEDDPIRREAASRVLSGIGSPSVKPLLAALKNEDKNVRSAAADTLKGLYKQGSLGEADKKSILSAIPDAGYVSPFTSLHSDHSDDYSGISGDGLVEICQH